MDMETLIQRCRDGEHIPDDDQHIQDLLTESGQEAQKITMKLNNTYHSQAEIVELFRDLTGQDVDDSFVCFPPFYSNFGKNITIGKNVFVNIGCSFQDRGGIHIADNVMIGMNVVIATLNHGLAPEERQSTTPAPVHIGKNAWIGSSATILPGVTIGENAVVAAGAVVTKDVPANTVVAGVPATFIKEV